MVTEVTSYQPNLKMHSFIDTDISEMGAIEKQIPTIWLLIMAMLMSY